jgi:hypothetical protein
LGAICGSRKPVFVIGAASITAADLAETAPVIPALAIGPAADALLR